MDLGYRSMFIGLRGRVSSHQCKPWKRADGIVFGSLIIIYHREAVEMKLKNRKMLLKD